MALTPFSHFSAASELFVTAGVFYFFWRALAKDDFRWALIWIVIAFETVFNITYMISRIGPQGTAEERPAWALWLLAGHGTLSLLMFLGLISILVLAFRARHVEKENYFAARPVLTWTFLVLWCLSILSGEAIYVLQLAGALHL